MQTVTSKDGTKITYDKSGQGPVVVIVTGATGTRGGHMAKLAELLSKNLTVYNYDRRGRGDSTDTLPYSLNKEIEDINALVDASGGTAGLYGISSGGALVLEAASALGSRVNKLAVYEVPYDESETGIKKWHVYRSKLKKALKENDRGAAITLFMELVGVPSAMIENMSQSPMWPSMEKLAHTLEYDAEALGKDRTIPSEKLSKIRAESLIIYGGSSADNNMPFMKVSAEKMAKTIPKAMLKTIAGQSHDIDPTVLAPVLIEFFKQ